MEGFVSQTNKLIGSTGNMSQPSCHVRPGPGPPVVGLRKAETVCRTQSSENTSVLQGPGPCPDLVQHRCRRHVCSLLGVKRKRVKHPRQSGSQPRRVTPHNVVKIAWTVGFFHLRALYSHFFSWKSGPKVSGLGNTVSLELHKPFTCVSSLQYFKLDGCASFPRFSRVA